MRRFDSTDRANEAITRSGATRGAEVPDLIEIAKGILSFTKWSFHELVEAELFRLSTVDLLYTEYHNGLEDPAEDRSLYFLSRLCHDINDIVAGVMAMPSTYDDALERAEEEFRWLYPEKPLDWSEVLCERHRHHWLEVIDPVIEGYVVNGWTRETGAVLRLPLWLHGLLTTQAAVLGSADTCVFADRVDAVSQQPHIGYAVRVQTDESLYQLMQAEALQGYSLDELLKVTEALASENEIQGA